jgi:hypothetical protein
MAAFTRGPADGQFRRRDEFAAASSSPQFEQVLAAGERVLWSFVRDQTPDVLREHINQVRFGLPERSDAHRCQLTQGCLLRRAVFLEDLNCGKAYQAEWYAVTSGEGVK